jgi:uncharacterized membrane protein
MNLSKSIKTFIAPISATSLSRYLSLALLSFSTLSIVTIGEAKPAQAWFQICNHSTQKVSTAFAYWDMDARRPDIFGLVEPTLDRGWTSEGWWILNSGECAQVYPHDLSERNSTYYVYAQAFDGGEWGKGTDFCVVPRSAFTVGNANGKCGGEGVWKDFNEVNTGNSRNYTYTLNE